MSIAEKESVRDVPSSLEIVPRFPRQGYTDYAVDTRRSWVEDKTGASLVLVGATAIPAESTRGNIENPIGSIQMPLGVAGPLKVCGENAKGDFFVPLATTEGALVKSYERGAVAISRAGGAHVRISNDSNCCSPIFTFGNIVEAADFIGLVKCSFDKLVAVAASTTNHGRLVSANCRQVGRDVVVDLKFFTADAHGMNMSAKSTEAICQWLKQQCSIECHLTLSGASSEKRASGAAFRVGKGKHVTAGVVIDAKTVKRHFFTTPQAICRMWHRTVLAQLQAGTIGFNGHVANGLTAIFIACGQDVANVTNGSVAVTSLETDSDNNLIASVTLPSLNVATVGGGTGIGTSKECLTMMDCFGSGKSGKFAEIVAATILAGELSFGASLAHGDFAGAHEKYGRNRPDAN